MATFTYGGAGVRVDMTLPNIPGLFGYPHYIATRTSLKLHEGSSYTLFGGTGFTYTTGQGNRLLDINSGTLNSIKSVHSGVTVLVATGLNVSAAKLADAAFSGQEAKFAALLLAGNDTINATIYADKLLGLAGDDTLVGGAGADRLDGGTGVDTASYAGAAKGVVASLASTSANTNDAKGDVYISIENLTGSSHADKLTGNSSVNVLSGGAGDDILNAAGGNDTIYGGAGADDLYGGAGLDKFQFKALSESTVALAGRDTIFDFSGAGGDKIDLSAIDANTKSSGDQGFSFIGTAAFNGKAGELRYIKGSSDTYIYGDVNGDGKVDFAIHLDDALTLSKGYFVL